MGKRLGGSCLQLIMQKSLKHLCLSLAESEISSKVILKYLLDLVFWAGCVNVFHPFVTSSRLICLHVLLHHDDMKKQNLQATVQAEQRLTVKGTRHRL